MNSWKTTFAGLIAGAALIFPELNALIDNDPETIFNLQQIIVGLGAMGFGVFARDNDKTSEQVKANKK